VWKAASVLAPGLVAQSADSASPSSDNPQAGQAQFATPGRVSDHGAPQTNISARGKVSKGKLIHKVNPNYPAALRRADIQGAVVLCGTGLETVKPVDSIPSVCIFPPVLFSPRQTEV
jgi:hypothetical protein